MLECLGLIDDGDFRQLGLELADLVMADMAVFGPDDVQVAVGAEVAISRMGVLLMFKTLRRFICAKGSRLLT